MDASVAVTGDADRARRDFDRVAMTSPTKAARQILAAVEKNQRRALIGPDAKLIDLIARLPSGVSTVCSSEELAGGRSGGPPRRLSPPPLLF